MRISLNWLKEYIDINQSPDEVGALLTDLGLEVEGGELTETIKGGLKGVVVGYVKTCQKHPDADKLSLTTVDVGQENDLHIVCGAPNVAAGQKVLVATIGTNLTFTDGKELTIKEGKIRGQVSQGMICAEDELGLGNSHEGIMILPDDAKVGTSAKDFFNFETDYIFEIGLTPNRSDATCHIGVAKDIAAALAIRNGQKAMVKMPSIADFKIDNHALPIEVTVENTEACPRYAGVSIKGITVKESPEWLKRKVLAAGMRPINNIVDVTNFILHEFGQPLHAFDADKIKGNKVIVKTLPHGTIFKSLDEVDRKLFAEDLMICDSNEDGMCIGGVFGGISSGVSNQTSNIFLEAAHFNPKSIRQSSMRHNLRTDAAKVFEKGSDPNICVYALKRAAMLIKEVAGGEIASEVIDIYPQPIAKKQIEVHYNKVNQLIGIAIDKTAIKNILAALEMDTLAESNDSITVAVPTNKADVLREVDVIEEILRIYGFNNVPIPQQIRSAITKSEKPDSNEYRNKIGDFLAANGFNEMMAMSLTYSKYFTDILPIAEENLVFVQNSANIQDVMRPTMLFSGLESIVHNQRRQQADLRLFEFGKTYLKKEDKKYNETAKLTLFLTGKRYSESWLNGKEREKEQVSFYTLKSIVENVLSRLGITTYQVSAESNDNLIFSSGLKYHRGAQNIVTFGSVHPKLLKKMEVKGNVLYADFDWDTIMNIAKKATIQITEPSRFPSVRRDLAMVVDNATNFGDIVTLVRKTAKNILKDVNLFDVYENEEQLGKNKKSYAVSFVFEDNSKTLQEKEIEGVMNNLIRNLEEKLGANIRKS